MWWWTYVALALAISGCGKGIVTPTADRGKFETYFQAFEAYSKDEGRDTFGDVSLVIGFGALDEQEAGRCEWNFLKGRHVLIDETKWDKMSEGTREALVLHELGHCLLHRSHVEGLADPGATGNDDMVSVPKSLMNPNCVPGDIYLKFKSYYLDELFGKR